MNYPNILLLGTVVSPELSSQFVSLNINPGPAEIVQKYLITGLTEHEFESITVLSAPRIPSFPQVRLKRVKSCEWNIESAHIESVGFVNYEGISFLDRERKIIHLAKKWADKHSDGRMYVLVYSMHSPFLKAARSIKNKYPRTKVGIIVPDLPQYMAVHKGIKKVFKSYDMKRIDRLLDCVDKYVLYTKYMAEHFHLKDGQWIVLEGLMNNEKIKPNNRKKNSGRKICLYAGRLDSRYAIDKLIEAFKEIPNTELHLYGSPQDAEKFKNLLDETPNVKYLGTLSQDDVFVKMQEADLLLNPRPSNIELAKYSCPSKTFEYMASGTPVLMTRLPGLPEEYYPYLFFIEEETVKGYREAIIETLKLNPMQLEEKGLLAQQFLLRHKNSSTQVSRIVSFLLETDEI